MRQEEMKLYLDRCRRFWRRCEPDLFIESIPVRAEFARTAEPVPFDERLKLEYILLRWTHLHGEAVH